MEVERERDDPVVESAQARRARVAAVEARTQTEGDVRVLTSACDTAVAQGDIMEVEQDIARVEREVATEAGDAAVEQLTGIERESARYGEG